MNLDRKKALILLSVVGMVAMLSAMTLTALASGNDEEINGMSGLFGKGHGLRFRWEGRRFGCIEVSEEYETNVINIAESDSDVQGYLAEGYSYIGVRPIIKSIVNANGDVTNTATNAIYVLENEDATSYVSVWVDLDAESVTKIVILTRTVIEKT